MINIHNSCFDDSFFWFLEPGFQGRFTVLNLILVWSNLSVKDSSLSKKASSSSAVTTFSLAILTSVMGDRAKVVGVSFLIHNAFSMSRWTPKIDQWYTNGWGLSLITLRISSNWNNLSSSV